MLLSFLLSYLSRKASFVWAPSLDLSDGTVYSTLLHGTQY